MKKMICFFVVFACLCIYGATNVYASSELGLGFRAGWTNFDNEFLEGLSFGFPITFGYTSAEIRQRRANKLKLAGPLDFDIFVDIDIGIPISRGGGIFNFYIFPETLPISIGVGGGWAAGYDLTNLPSSFVHGPYVRGAICAVNSMLGVTFDYFFFEKNCIQIGAYLKFIL